eukprot:s1_g1456.t1
MRPMTETVPKAMLEIAGRPFIDHQLMLMHKKGIRKVVICTGYLGESIQEHVGNGQDFGLEVRYSFDGEKLLGTGGALRKALPLLGDVFFVTYGDSYLEIDYSQMIECMNSTGLPAIMALYRNDGLWDTSNADIEGNKAIYSKSSPARGPYIDYGVSLMSRAVLEQLPADSVFDLAKVLERTSQAGKLGAFEVFDRFYEIGTLAGLQATEAYILSRQSHADSTYNERS